MLLRRASLRALVAAVTMVGLAAAAACGTEPVGVDSCRKIEGARCENARSCGIDLSKPVHPGDTPSQDVGACKRFYEDACLHGLAAPTDPGSVAVQACVDAINGTADCEVIKSPEKDPACAFLIPPPPPPPAPVEDAAVADTSTE